jgi:hypothetical protein
MSNFVFSSYRSSPCIHLSADGRYWDRRCTLISKVSVSNRISWASKEVNCLTSTIDARTSGATRSISIAFALALPTRDTRCAHASSLGCRIIRSAPRLLLCWCSNAAMLISAGSSMHKGLTCLFTVRHWYRTCVTERCGPYLIKVREGRFPPV